MHRTRRVRALTWSDIRLWDRGSMRDGVGLWHDVRLRWHSRRLLYRSDRRLLRSINDDLSSGKF